MGAWPQTAQKEVKDLNYWPQGDERPDESVAGEVGYGGKGK